MSVSTTPPDAGWTVTSAAVIGDGPYPGNRPTGSWRLRRDGSLHRIDEIDEVDTSGRTLVIAYGSNANPNKLLQHPALFDDGDVIALQAVIVGWAAAWCNARRTRDHAVVATLVPWSRRTEIHPLLALTDPQLALVDAWEGHPVRYRRMRHDGPVRHADGRPIENVEVYAGTAEVRPTLLVDGRPLLCADVPYDVVDRLVT